MCFAPVLKLIRQGTSGRLDVECNDGQMQFDLIPHLGLLLSGLVTDSVQQIGQAGETGAAVAVARTGSKYDVTTRGGKVYVY